MASMRVVQVSEQGGRVRAGRSARCPRRARARRSCACTRAASATATRSPKPAASLASPGRTSPVTRSRASIAALGEGVRDWEVGQRVGVGWFGGNCGYCEPLPPRRSHGLRAHGDPRHHDRRRLRRLRAREGERDGRDPRRALSRRGRAAAVRGHHHLQRAAPQRRPRRRPGRGPRRRRARAPRRCSSRPSSASTPSRSPAAPPRRSWRASSAPATTSTAPPRTPPRS